MDLNSILIGSEDPAALVAYYEKVLGEPGFNDGGYTGWQIGTGFLTVGPHDEVKGKNGEPGRVLWNIESADVAADFERMKTAGATVVQEPYHPGVGDNAEMWIATFEDPDGNYFQLMSPMG